MSETYISIDHLSKKYDKDFVLKDVNAVLRSGEILGFLGPSGAGKTTTIKILTGQLMPTSGNAEVLGIDCRKIDERIYEQIGIVTDSSGVYERMTVFDNLKYFARILNVPLENIDPLLKRIGLYEHRKKPAAKLSKGQTQRLILARALLHKPKVLFLDEPTSGLDPVSRDELLQILAAYIEDGEHSVLFSTHITGDLERAADYITYIRYGELFFTGSREEFVDQFRILKGGPDELTADLKARAAGLRVFPTGFEALVKTADATAFPALCAEPATIDQILVFTNREEEE